MSLTPGVILPCYGPARHAQVSTSWNITWHQMVSSDTKLDNLVLTIFFTCQQDDRANLEMSQFSSL